MTRPLSPPGMTFPQEHTMTTAFQPYPFAGTQYPAHMPPLNGRTDARPRHFSHFGRYLAGSSG